MADVPVSSLTRPLVPALRSLSSRLALWVPVVLYMTLIFSLSSVSDVPALPGGMSDKSAHALLYAGLGILLVRALAGGRGTKVGAGTFALTILIAAVYGLSDEIHQLFVPGRQFDLRDLAADGIGAAVAAGLGWAWGIIRRRSASL